MCRGFSVPSLPARLGPLYLAAAGLPPTPGSVRPFTAQCKDSAAAMEVFEEMRARRVQPDVVAYTSMLTALQGTPQVRGES